jgi:hypothetical protein
MPKGKPFLPNEEGASTEYLAACLGGGFALCLVIRAAHYLTAHNVSLLIILSKLNCHYTLERKEKGFQAVWDKTLCRWVSGLLTGSGDEYRSYSIYT